VIPVPWSFRDLLTFAGSGWCRWRGPVAGLPGFSTVVSLVGPAGRGR
jgi:hypothetical protein